MIRHFDLLRGRKMNTLSVEDFKTICNKLHPQEIILHSDNQSFSFGEIGIKFDLRFTDINICLNPDIISLIIGKSRLQLDKIKAIYKRNRSPLGYRYDILCTGFLDTNKITIHTLILR